MQYDCPRDSYALAKEEVSSGVAWRCSTCSGALFLGLVTERVAASDAASGKREYWDPEVKCPRDGASMSMVNLGSAAIDCCTQCGAIWMDGEEVERLLELPQAERLKSGEKSSSDLDWSDGVVDAIIGVLLDGQ